MDIKVFHDEEDNCFYVLRKEEDSLPWSDGTQEWEIIGEGETSEEAFIMALKQVNKIYNNLSKAIQAGFSSIMEGCDCFSEDFYIPTAKVKTDSSGCSFNKFLRLADGTFSKAHV